MFILITSRYIKFKLVKIILSMCVADGKYCFCMFNLTNTTINYDDTWKIKRSKKKKYTIKV